jgi:CO/xanthine dehydrogenase Mo-binding subunit
MNVIGSRMIRRDARVRATGAARYTEDYTVPDMLYAVLVGSPIASGRIVHVDIKAAQQSADVVRVLTAADVPDRRYGNYRRDQPILAKDVVRFVGEPVAMVAATNLAAAHRAARKIQAHVEPVSPVLDLAEAAQATSTTVHDADTNTIERVIIRRGDVETVFREARLVVTTRIETQRAHQAALEPRAVLVEPKDAGLSVVMSTQQPFGVRGALAELFAIPVGCVEVRVPAIGGGFGGKLHLGFAPQAAAMALATGRPVRLVCTRSEEMETGSPRENAIIELSSAVAEDGKIRGRRCDILLDAGAYALDTPILASMAAFYATGPYEIEALHLTSRAIYTNTCPTGSFRGPTGPQMVYAVEAHLDEIAATLGIDRVAVRRRNFIKCGQRGPTGELIIGEPGAEKCLDVVLQRLEAFRADGRVTAPDSRRRGYGFACAWWSTLGTASAATVQVHEDGTATVSSGGTEIGTGAISTGVPAIVAETLGLTLEDVILVSGSTRDAPFDSGSRGSRTQYAAGNAALLAALEVARQLKEEAAQLLEVAPADLVLRAGQLQVIGSPSTALPIAQVVGSALARTGPIVGGGRYRAALVPLTGSELEGARFSRLGEPTFHCHGVEIALDEETGQIEVLRYVAAHDVGRILNPVGARGQVEGGVVQGIGYALFENLQTDSTGRIRNADFVDYRLPTIADIPQSIETIFIETNEAAQGPFGAKGLGEPPVILAAAAIGSAVRDILGRQPMRLPLDAASIAAFMSSIEPGSHISQDTRFMSTRLSRRGSEDRQ